MLILKIQNDWVIICLPLQTHLLPFFFLFSSTRSWPGQTASDRLSCLLAGCGQWEAQTRVQKREERGPDIDLLVDLGLDNNGDLLILLLKVKAAGKPLSCAATHSSFWKHCSFSLPFHVQGWGGLSAVTTPWLFYHVLFFKTVRISALLSYDSLSNELFVPPSTSCWDPRHVRIEP